MGSNRIGLVWGDREWPWTELDERVDCYAYGLRQLGLNRPNSHPARVAIALPNRPDFALAYFAALRAGLVAVPINPAYTGRELHQLLSDAGASVLIAGAGVIAAIDTFGAPLPELGQRFLVGTGIDAGGPDGARVHGADGDGKNGRENGGRSIPGTTPWADLAVAAGPVEPTTGDEDLAVLLYTSGSEGRPKGAMLSHRALLANHEQLARIDPPPIGPDDVVLLAVPLFHAYGLNSGLGAVAYHGACGVLLDSADSIDSATVNLPDERRLSALLGVPAMFSVWAQLADPAALASVRVAVSGAAPLEPAITHQFEAVWSGQLAVGYGLTETAPGVTTTLASPERKEGSIGRALPGIDVRLVNAAGADVWRSDAPAVAAELDDFDDDAAGSPGTDPGEIVVRGANLFSGYWPDGHDGPDPNGWWATGDVAFADADGDLFLVDRLRELILVNGFNVYPAEVEQVLTAHPAIAEAAVIGIPHLPSGQSVTAYVVVRPPEAGVAAVSPTDLATYCARNLARYKCPSEFEFVAELPHSATGKVRKAALRDARPVAGEGPAHDEGMAHAEH
jgi:long-chain acyl-CoA synthetase